MTWKLETSFSDFKHIFRRLEFVLLVYAIGAYVCLQQIIYKYVYITKNTKNVDCLKDETEKPQDERVAIVTGGSSGIGQASVKKLLNLGYVVISASRNHCERELFPTEENYHELFLNLADQESVVDFANHIKKNYEKIDLLLNCAGVMFVPLQMASKNVENHVAINYQGHFLLVKLLLHHLTKAQDSCVINLTSSTAWLCTENTPELFSTPTTKSYSPHASYAASKMMLILFTYKLQNNLKFTDGHVNAVVYDPGTVLTPLYQHSGSLFNFFMWMFGKILLRTPNEAADDIEHILKNYKPKNKYFVGWKRKYEYSGVCTYKADLQNMLWQNSECAIIK